MPVQMAEKIRNIKLFAILLPDMLLMASKGQGYFWEKNWLTEKLSGKKGFVGEFDYAKDDYLKLKSADYEKNRKKRLITSLAVGFGSALSLPLLLSAILKTPASSAKGVLPALKKLVPAFNYSNAIYMSKWVLAWHTFFNWNFPSVLSARDNHELRENAVKTSVLLGLYTVGDDIVSGLLAKTLDRYARSKAKTPILSGKKGLLGLPKLMPLEDIMNRYGKDSLAYKLGRGNFWLGILGICMAINSILPALNNYYTRKKVEREQADLKPIRTPQVAQSAPVSPAPGNIPNTPPQPRQIAYPLWPSQPQWLTNAGTSA